MSEAQLREIKSKINSRKSRAKLATIGCEKVGAILAVGVTRIAGTIKEQDQENPIANKSKKERKDDDNWHHLQAKQQLTKEMNSNSKKKMPQGSDTMIEM
ncbi:hypothetical protein SLA2020_234840 [Shorea laevis]